MIDPNRYLAVLACLAFIPHLIMEVRGVKALEWVRATLAGHVTLFACSWAGLVSLVFLYLMQQRASLTPASAGDIVGICAMGGIIAGGMCWFTISRPYLRRLTDSMGGAGPGL
jgi:hypothetical protein